MASLSDLSAIYAPSAPPGFTLADIELAGTQAQNEADISSERILRNFGQFQLPDLLSSQAARGAFQSSATDNKALALTTGAADQLTDIQFGLGQTQANLASNALLAQTGITLGGGY